MLKKDYLLVENLKSKNSSIKKINNLTTIEIQINYSNYILAQLLK